MATILKHLPSESMVTKIEYEGPYIGLHTKMPRFLLEHQDLVSQLVNSIKKRIVIRTDASIRSSERSTRQILNSICLSNADISDVFFDPTIGEATVFARDMSVLSMLSQHDIELTEKTGWRMSFRRQPKSIKIFKYINDVLSNRSAERVLFYKRTGENIFRAKLDGLTEASIVCLGGFNEIGRSSILLITHNSKVLLDFGMKRYQNDNLDCLPRIDVSGLSMEEIDGIIISHGHFGHAGALPLLFKYGYDGPVYCTDPTLPLMIALQKNYTQIQKKNAIYSKHEIDEVILHTIPVNFGSVTDISPDLRVMLSNSGHILGSSTMHLHIGNGDHNLVYSGDLKFGKTTAIDNAVWNFPRVETLIIESTHGNREDSFPLREEVEINLTNSINATLDFGGGVLIPVPPLGISQELCITLGMLNNMGKINPEKILVAESILELLDFYEIYTEYLSRNLKSRISAGENDPLYTDLLTPLDIKRDDWSKCVILAPSADLTDGESFKLLKEFSNEPRHKVILVSNTAPDSISLNLVSGQKDLQVGKRKIQLNCSVDMIKGFTDHSDYNQILAYVSRLKPRLRKVITNHGSEIKCHVLAANINKIFKIPTQHPSVHESIKLL